MYNEKKNISEKQIKVYTCIYVCYMCCQIFLNIIQYIVHKRLESYGTLIIGYTFILEKKYLLIFLKNIEVRGKQIIQIKLS